MYINRKLRLRMLLQNAMFTVLFLIMIGLLAYLSRTYHTQWDFTQNTRNSLSSASLNLLAKLQGPVQIKAYATKRDPRLGDIRARIRDFVSPYSKAKGDLTLEFIDPAEQPQLARAAGVRVNGEMVVEYQGRSDHLTQLNEQALSNTLMRLGRKGERHVRYVDGHGERKLDGAANHDLGEFGSQLERKGFKISPLSLATAQDVPLNTSVLVITSPQVDLLPGEVDKIRRYVDRGGNLLWLIDQEPLHGLQPLAEQLGLILSPGTVVDPAAQRLRAPATWAIASSYGPHAITQNFDLVTVFPFARQIAFSEGKGWHVTPLLEVAQNGWVETGKLDDHVAFDKLLDIPGPVTIGITLERNVEDQDQRVTVVGSGEFLSNTYLGNGGNADLGINIVNWLAGDDNLITIQPRAALDNSLNLSKTAATVISIGFMILLPLALLAAGIAIWWRRRQL
jgi:ABC-type uncharacterized transport system involved in gliding motility auxiliary subunit